MRFPNSASIERIVTDIPILYLVQSPATHKVRPWHHFRIDGVMVSAYELMLSRRKREALITRGWADILEFDGPVMLDSGGFQYLKGKQVSYSPEELARFAKETDSDFVLSLDHPPRTNCRDFDSLAKLNFRNYLRMLRIVETIPVVHAPPYLAAREIRMLKRVKPTYVGVGGLVPSLRGAMKMTFETIDLVQRELPDCKIHLLGFVAPKIGLSYSSRAYSLDYGGWRNAAATGYLLTPTGYRKISSRNKKGHAAKPSSSEMETIKSICNKLQLTLHSLRHDFESRAIFSAYVATEMFNGFS